MTPKVFVSLILFILQFPNLTSGSFSILLICCLDPAIMYSVLSLLRVNLLANNNVALTRVTEEILLNMDNKLIAGAVFIDLRKTFDTADHSLAF